MDAHTLPLAGVQVVDLSTYAAVPAAARILADWGADVIKVESLQGDAWRHYGDIAEVPCTDEENPCWDVSNSNKRGLALNLRTAAGQTILHRLLARADVFVSNYRMAALEGLHVTYEELHEQYPRLVWGHLSGYGPVGPEAKRPGFDIAAFWARSGLMQDYSSPGEPPLMPFHAFGDMTTGSVMVGGLCAALYKQLRTGIGDKVELSLLGTATWLMAMPAVAAQPAYGNTYPRERYEHPSPVCIPYQCADGEWLELCIMEYERYRVPFLTLLGLERLLDDERFTTFYSIQVHAREFVSLVQEAFLKKTRDEWGTLLSAADIVYDKISHFKDITECEQAWANGYVYTRKFPNGHTAVLPKPPIQFQDKDTVPQAAPLLGEHMRDILLEYGYTEAEIEALIKEHVVHA